MASRQLDRWVEEEHCDPADVVNSLLLLFGDEEVQEQDFTSEQWEMIKQGEAEADAGDFASQEEVEALFQRYRSVA
jgi:hypothetical protein